jgi:hypothetical protein
MKFILLLHASLNFIHSSIIELSVRYAVLVHVVKPIGLYEK